MRTEENADNRDESLPQHRSPIYDCDDLPRILCKLTKATTTTTTMMMATMLGKRTAATALGGSSYTGHAKASVEDVNTFLSAIAEFRLVRSGPPSPTPPHLKPRNKPLINNNNSRSSNSNNNNNKPLINNSRSSSSIINNKRETETETPLPPLAGLPFPRSFDQTPVTSLAISPCGTFLVCGCRNGLVGIWELETAQYPERYPSRVLKITIPNIQEPITAVRLSPCNTTLALAYGRRITYIKNYGSTTEQQPPARTTSHDHHNHVNDVVFWDSEKVVSAHQHNDIVVCTTDPDNFASTPLRGHTKPVLALARSSDGQQFASTSVDGTIRVWEPRKAGGFQCIVVLQPQTIAIRLAYSPSTKLLASFSPEHGFDFWDAENGCLHQVIPLQDKTTTSIAFCHGGDFFVSGSATGIVRMWKIGTGKCRKEFHTNTKASILSLAISPDNTFVVAGFSKGLGLLNYDFIQGV